MAVPRWRPIGWRGAEEARSRGRARCRWRLLRPEKWRGQRRQEARAVDERAGAWSPGEEVRACDGWSLESSCDGWRLELGFRLRAGRNDGPLVGRECHPGLQPKQPGWRSAPGGWSTAYRWKCQQGNKSRPKSKGMALTGVSQKVHRNDHL